MPKKTPTAVAPPKRHKATTPEGRDNQLIAATYDLVEQRILNGTASPSETVHFLKMGSPKSRLEQELLEEQIELTKAKAKAYQAAEHSDELYDKAIKAMRDYSGHGGDEDAEDLY